MSLGIDFTTNIHLEINDFVENTHCVQERIDELNEICQDLKERMLMLVAGNRNMVCTRDWEGIEYDAVDALHIKFTTMLDSYSECMGEINDLYLYKEYLENKENGNS